MTRTYRVLFVAAVLQSALNVGCGFAGSYRTARTLGVGHVRLSAEASAVGLVREDSVRLGPNFSVSGALGVSDQVDLLGRAGLTGASVGVRAMLTEPTSRIAVAAVPTIGVWGIGIMEEKLHLLLDLPLGRDATLVVGGMGHLLHDPSIEGRGIMTLGAGGSLGYHRAWGQLRLGVEISGLVALIGTYPGGGYAPAGTANPVVELGFRLAWDTR